MTIHKVIKGALLAVLATTAGACAQNLHPFDMENIPLQDIELRGGQFIASLLESDEPYHSQLLMECQDCTAPADALVGLSADVGNEGAEFAADPDGFVMDVFKVCTRQAQPCIFRLANIGTLKGYAYTATYADGATIVEHVYFDSGLTYVINAFSASAADAEANVDLLLKVVSPFVMGENQ